MNLGGIEIHPSVLELLRIVAAIIIPLIALLRTRTDLDRFIAAQRAKETGEPVETQIRKRWYHKLKPKRKPRSKS